VALRAGSVRIRPGNPLMAHVGPAMVSVFAVVVVLSCNRRVDTGERQQSDRSGASSIERPIASVAPRVSSESPNKEPIAELQRDPVCARLREGISFFECNDPPRTKEYPDCRTFAFQADVTGCPPEELDLSIVGYPGLAEKFRVRASSERGSSRGLTITLVRTSTQTRDHGLIVGARLAVLDIDANRPAKMLVGAGLHAYTLKKTIGQQSSEPPSLPSADRRPGDPIPLGNGQFVKGLD
jgi:hypothetical protein